MGEHEGTVDHVALHGIALVPLARQQLLGERVLDEALDGAAQGACAVGKVRTLGDDLLDCGVGEDDVHAVGDQALAQVVHQQLGDGCQRLAGELLEHHDVIDAVQELGAEQALELAHRATADLVCGKALLAGGAKAHGCILGDLAGAHVGRHDDHGVAEVYRLALAIRQASLVQNLQKDVEDIRVGLLDLVEQHHGVRVAADRLGELAALLVAHVSRRATDELGDLVLAGELRHVEADERVLAAEQVLRQGLGELGLTRAGGTEEDERAAGTTRVLERRAAAADSLGHGLNRLVLSDDAGLENALALQQAAALVLGQRGDGHAGGDGDDVGDLLGVDDERMGVHLGRPVLTSLGELLLGGLLVLFDLRGAVHVVARRRLIDRGLELGDTRFRVANGLRGLIGGDAGAGTGLVHKVDGLVRQKAVLDVARRQVGRGLDGGGRVGHVVVLGVAGSERVQDLDGIRNAGLLDVDRLEAALERGILLQVLAELLGRGGADDLEGAASQHGLEHGARVDGTLCGARADQRVHLIDEQDDVIGLRCLGDNVLESLLELAAVLGSGHQAGKVQRPDVLVHEVLRHVAGGDLLRQPLDDGGLADARIAQDQRVVLGAAGQDLHHARDLFLTSDNGIELAGACLVGEVGAELL